MNSTRNSKPKLGMEEPDPLVRAIRNLEDGFADYNANAPHDDDGAIAYAEVSYRPPRRVLEQWRSPACSLRGVAAALRLAKFADDEGDGAILSPMIGAALGYFEARA